MVWACSGVDKMVWACSDEFELSMGMVGMTSMSSAFANLHSCRISSEQSESSQTLKKNIVKKNNLWVQQNDGES